MKRHVSGYERVLARHNLFQGRKYKLVVRRSYQEDFQRAAAKAGLPRRRPPCCTASPASGNPALNPACSRATKGSRPGGRTAPSRLGLADRRAASGSSRCSGLTGQQGGHAYSVLLRWTMASYSCSYVIGGSGIGCARSAR